jgi:hypothetical protein
MKPVAITFQVDILSPPFKVSFSCISSELLEPARGSHARHYKINENWNSSICKGKKYKIEL